MGAQVALLERPKVPRLAWAVPLLPVALSVFFLSALGYYQVQRPGAEADGYFQAMVIGLYHFLGFVPAFMGFLLVLIWSSIWFITRQLEIPWARALRILALVLSLALLVNLGSGDGTGATRQGILGSYLALRLESVFGLGLSTLLAVLASLASVLLATDFFFYRYFDALSGQAKTRSLARQEGVETQAVEELRSLSFPDLQARPLSAAAVAEPSRGAAASQGPLVIEEDPLDFEESDLEAAAEPELQAVAVAGEEPEEEEPAEEEEADADEIEYEEEVEEEVEGADEEEPEEEKDASEEEHEDEELDEDDEDDEEDEEEEGKELSCEILRPESSQEEQAEAAEEVEETEEEEYEEEEPDDEEAQGEKPDPEEPDPEETEPQESEERQGQLFPMGAADPDVLEEATRLVLSSRRASATFLQRRLRVGYDEALALLNALRDRGVVGGVRGEPHGQVLLDS